MVSVARNAYLLAPKDSPRLICSLKLRNFEHTHS